MPASPSSKTDMADKMYQQTEAKQKGLDNDWATKVTKLELLIDGCIQEQVAVITSHHQERLNELQKLIAKKLQIESNIVATTAKLQEVYAQTKQVLEVVLDGRIGDCESGLTQLGSLKESTSNGQWVSS
ncbi:hypothetical protein H2198_001450 [Neophaeococcomyces mojaviensis]|uniref:Uncharacterized protein n=1 Tax=Neophaeococcomyces mojaviensis TaxID=3383035 RepID=A0ACC3AHV0_9EURO|nr:hypothetical protein H2198_001450 [Knufia sp. JES_112]